MRCLRSYIISIVFVLTVSPFTLAQSTFSIQVGPSIPLSDFNMYQYFIGDVEVPGSASVGINAGVKYSYQFSDLGFGLFAGCEFLYNGMNNEYKSTVEELHSNMGHDIEKLHTYINIPTSSGFSYRYNFLTEFAIVSNLGITLNFLKVTDFVSKYYTNETDWTSSFGIKVGVGLLFKDKVSVQVDYLGLGKHNVTCRDKMKTDYTSNTELNIHLLTVTAGLHF